MTQLVSTILRSMTRMLMASLAALACAACGSSDAVDDETSTADGSASLVRLAPPPGSEGLFMISGGSVGKDLIAVGEWSSSKVHLYNSDGTFLRSLGGPGEGPGEFTRLGWVQVVGERVVATDQGAGRLATFGSAGELLSTETLATTPDGRRTSVRGVFSDGSFLATVRPGGPPQSALGSGVSASTFELVLLAPDGSFIRPLGTMVGAEYVVTTSASGGAMFPSVFGKGSGAIVRDTFYYVFDPREERVHRLDRSGARSATYGMGRQGVELTRDMVATVRARLVAETPIEERPEEMFDASPLPSHVPLYGWAGFLPRSPFSVSSTGEVWMLRYGGLESPVPEWKVYSADGTFRGTVRGPERAWILDMSVGRTLLLKIDADGVESLELVTLPAPQL